MNAIPKKSTLNIDWTTQRLLEAEQEILVDADTVALLNQRSYLMSPVADKPVKHSLIRDRFMSYTQKVCDDWSKHGYGDYL